MHNEMSTSASVSASDSAISIQNVIFTYPGSEEPVLNGASLELPRGSFTAIIGGNGCGKSTLCKLFNGLIPQFYTGDFSGEVHVLGMPAEGRSVADLSRKIGYVYQDFDNQLVRPTVLDEACFAPLNYGLPNYRELGERALAMCGLDTIHNRYIWELSGGQKHLLALAGALSLDPDILIVDEPVSQLDPQHARLIYECLSKLNTEYGKTIIVIEHHTEFIADFCADVVLMDKGRVLWNLPVKEGLNRIADLERLGIQPPEVTRAAIQAAELSQGEKTIAGLSGSERRFPITVEEANVYFAEHYPSIPSASLQNEPSSYSNLARDVSSQIANTKRSTPAWAAEPLIPIVQFHQTRLRYRGLGKKEHEVIRGVNISLHEGERIALIGNNGAGKSSLLKMMAGISLPQEGSVSVLGEVTHRSSLEQLAGKVAYIFQNSSEMFIEDSVRKEVAYFLKNRRIPEADQQIAHVLERFRLTPLQERDARLLSGGQQRRVTLAIGAAMKPSLMLLDEPTANLDLATREELIGVLDELDQHVRTTVIATHDMQLVTQWASRVIVLHNGQVEADSTPADVFADESLLRRSGLALTQIMELSHRMGLPTLSPTTEAFVDTLLNQSLTKEDMHHAACPQLV
ncbi:MULTISPECIES: ABC transporter ATP-binding protein [unclassified Paenibacillus]|uniref:ABC transporter ATP-binding protein n=1 Tax=unclassified Paenibacillus TaxID=185978 RepID=UPI0009A62827|nr:MULTISPECIES: ABC transporter ATP-binding protein [unclassified Paenibacillus]SLK22636.1 energy-coupling factor transport system ATP-binding protein [Paenibacillus sp. RU5A]SOC77333.1 energy-coupling factor transport system ATP-binding protein [Paenibacillus sp. RU26A]SOC78375.1 energy-coupling factor transport system ATP-binding protein [Paenibacillus sp. RU5M]